MSEFITVDDAQARVKLAYVSDTLAGHNQASKAAWRAAGLYALRLFIDVFRTEGESIGQPWQKIHALTALLRRAGKCLKYNDVDEIVSDIGHGKYKTGQNTGTMRKSFQAGNPHNVMKATPSSVLAGSNYERLYQFTEGGEIPARPPTADEIAHVEGRMNSKTKGAVEEGMTLLFGTKSTTRKQPPRPLKRPGGLTATERTRIVRIIEHEITELIRRATK